MHISNNCDVAGGGLSNSCVHDQSAKDMLDNQASFETTSRLLSALVNEGLVRATVTRPALHGLGLQIESPNVTQECSDLTLWVGLAADTLYNGEDMTLLLHPDDLRLPVMIMRGDSRGQFPQFEVRPGILFDGMFPWFGEDESARSKIVNELDNSARNQGEWFRMFPNHYPNLESPFIDWERAVIRGHPLHPMHRTCFAQKPLAEVLPGELPQLLAPQILFLSILRKDVVTVGSFEASISSLLEEQMVAQTALSPERIIVPCLARQLPAILQTLGSSVIQLHSKPLMTDAQSSLRTVSPPAGSLFRSHLKLALSCQISSALRTISPWTSLVGPEVSDMLQALLPSSMSIFREVSAVTGSQQDFDQAKMFSVLIRENLDAQARAQGECLIMAASLAEKGVNSDKCHAERIFDLSSLQRKKDWFRTYTAKLLESALPPALHHGIGLEAHGQNICARFNIRSKALVGFAARDFGGLKLHMPTLRQQGYDIKSSPPGSLILVDDLDEVWENIHHTIFQSHLNQIVHGLGLHRDGGWAIVREELVRVLAPDKSDEASAFYSFLTRKKVPYKCFIRMKMQGLYRDYIHRDAPNVLLE